jgi:hypothetical protein
MKTETIVRKAAWLVLFLMMSDPVTSMPKNVSLQAVSVDDLRSRFRYVIVSGEIEARLSKQEKRHVEVLIEEGAFSANNLRELFKLVSARFKLPKQLNVHVYTSLQDIPTPEEREAPAISERQDTASLEMHAQAFFYRDGQGNEWFSYNHKKGSTELETIVLKGKVP